LTGGYRARPCVGGRVEWQAVEGENAAARRSRLSKTRYTCPGCGLSAWAKPGVHLVCGEYGERMGAEDGKGGR
jgi:hypothetical protein